MAQPLQYMVKKLYQVLLFFTMEPLSLHGWLPAQQRRHGREDYVPQT